MKQIILASAVAALTLLPTFGCCLCGGDEPPIPNPESPNKYAVLASSEIAIKDDVKYNSEFWYDLVVTYCTLIAQGFTEDNIFVLYSQGQDGFIPVDEDGVFLVGQDPSSIYEPYTTPFCDGAVLEITDIPLWKTRNVAKDNLCNVLCCLSTGRPAELKNGRCGCRESGNSGIGGFECSDEEIPWLTSEDFLFTWVKGHGGTTTCETKLGFKEGHMLRDDEIAELLNQLNPERWALMFETCNSGGWVDNFPNEDTAIVVVSSGDPDDDSIVEQCQETSWTATYDEMGASAGVQIEIVHGRWTYWLNTALRQLDLNENVIDSDVDGNNLVSILEDFSLAEQKIDEENSAFGTGETDFGGIMNPAINKSDGIAPCIFSSVAHPGKDYEIFSKDHDEDNSTVPSVQPGTIPLSSPDLWVRHFEDGGDEHQQPNSGMANFIYARVYNIGCSDPENVRVEFFLGETCTEEMQPDNFIAFGTVAGITPGASDLVSAKWEVDLPESTYCLIAELSTASETQSSQSSIASDNNKVQIEVVIADDT